MDVEVMKFLMEVRSHLTGSPRSNAGADAHLDLQAVERELPDCDWFEVEPVRRSSGEQALQWGMPGVLGFDA